MQGIFVAILALLGVAAAATAGAAYLIDVARKQTERDARIYCT